MGCCKERIVSPTRHECVQSTQPHSLSLKKVLSLSPCQKGERWNWERNSAQEPIWQKCHWFGQRYFCKELMRQTAEVIWANNESTNSVKVRVRHWKNLGRISLQWNKTTKVQNQSKRIAYGKCFYGLIFFLHFLSPTKRLLVHLYIY